MPKYELEALRTIRSLQAAYETGGRIAQAEQMRKIGDQVEAMADQLHTMTTVLRAKDADYAALKEAAKGLIAVHRRHKDMIVYSEQDYIDIWRERVDALAALVGEKKKHSRENCPKSDTWFANGGACGKAWDCRDCKDAPVELGGEE